MENTLEIHLKVSLSLDFTFVNKQITIKIDKISINVLEHKINITPFLIK